MLSYAWCTLGRHHGDYWRLVSTISQWLCIEYPPRSWPYRQAQAWFQRRGHAVVPHTADMAMHLAQHSAKPTTILVAKDGKWDRIIMERFD